MPLRYAYRHPPVIMRRSHGVITLPFARHALGFHILQSTRTFHSIPCRIGLPDLFAQSSYAECHNAFTVITNSIQACLLASNLTYALITLKGKPHGGAVPSALCVAVTFAGGVFHPN